MTQWAANQAVFFEGFFDRAVTSGIPDDRQNERGLVAAYMVAYEALADSYQWPIVFLGPRSHLRNLAAVLGVQSLMPQVFRSGLLLTTTSDQELEAIREKQIEE